MSRPGAMELAAALRCESADTQLKGVAGDIRLHRFRAGL